jgi:peroxiredoxin
MAEQLVVNIPAPKFELTDTNGQIIKLVDYRGKQPVVLVLLRGFV